LAEIFLTQLAIKYFIFHLTQRLLCTTWGKQTKHNSVKINEKTSINSIYPNLWVPTAGLLQSLIVVQQCVYQIKFRNVCWVEKRLVHSGLVWSRTLSILL